MKIEVKITGPRRSGKSTLARHLMTEIQEKLDICVSSPDVSIENCGVTELWTIKGANRAEDAMRAVLSAQNLLSEEEFANQYFIPLGKID